MFVNDNINFHSQDYFLQQQPSAKAIDYGDISERIALRKSMECKSFDWYLKNIYPELQLPGQTKILTNDNRPKYQPWHSR